MRIKGRLGEIKFKFNNTIDTMLYVPYEDVKFLIEQAERVHELEQQNKRYREAIERALGESGWGDEGNALYRTIGILTKALDDSQCSTKNG